MQKESEGLGMIKEEFEKLKDTIGGDIDQVREELQDLKHYEDLKKNMDKEILQQRLGYQEMIEGFRKKINEEKKSYELHLESISSEKSKIEEAKVEISFIEKKQENLNKRLEALREIVKSVERDLAVQNKIIADASSSMDKKVKDSERILKDMKYRLELDVEPILKKVKDNEEKMISIQNSILQKIISKHKDMNKYKLESTEAASKLKDFFDRRTLISSSISNLEKEKLDLEKEMKELINKAQSFSLSTRNTDIKKYIKELNESLEKIETKKSNLRSGLEKLTDLLKGK
jgi:chromosome segregation ATPase